MSLSLTNQSPKDVTLSYLENGILKEDNVTAGSVGSVMMSFTSTTQPPAVEFKAFEMGTANAVKLNGQESISISPTVTLETVSVVIGEGRLI